MPMTPLECLAQRNAYSYPAVGLCGTVARYAERTFPSIRAMERYHSALLRSSGDATAVLGYLSVLYWGHYAGQGQVARGPRALGRVRLAAGGAHRKRKGRVERMRGVADIGERAVAAVIRQAVGLVDSGQYGKALKMLSKLPQINFAFASKVCAFLLPEKCGVIDSVIARKHPQFGFTVDRGGYIRNNNTNAANYDKYCAFLTQEACVLNAIGSQFMWQDRDGTFCSWRAVDVERALY